MKIQRYKEPKSSFLSVEKDMALITNEMLKSERLKRLLFYNSKDAISRPNISEEQSLDMFGKNIKIIPKLVVDGSVLNYINIRFDNFTPNITNTEFRDNMIEFDIICHFDQWMLQDFQLRPYRIAAEIDSMFNNKHLTGIGTLQFSGATQIVLTNEYAGLCLMYSAIHGEEDKSPMANPKDQANFEKDFRDQYPII
jgi:hypothetical protein